MIASVVIFLTKFRFRSRELVRTRRDVNIRVAAINDILSTCLFFYCFQDKHRVIASKLKWNFGGNIKGLTGCFKATRVLQISGTKKKAMG